MSSFSSCRSESPAVQSATPPPPKLTLERMTAAPVDKGLQADAPLLNPAAQLAFTSMIRSIFQDSRGDYWFGSDLEGICRYDGSTFTYYANRHGSGVSQIRTIQEDEAGTIWIATGAGAFQFDGEKFNLREAKKPRQAKPNKLKTWQKKPSDLWFNGEREGGLYRYDGQEFSLLELPKTKPNDTSFSISGTITAITHGSSETLWVAGYGGVIGFDGAQFKFINERSLDYHVRSMLEDSQGRLWIGNNGIGVLKYEDNRTINFTNQMGVADETGNGGGDRGPAGTLNHVFAIAEDAQGNIWFGDRDQGAWRYDGKVLKNFTRKDGLPNQFVRTIFSDKEGLLWFGLEDGEVCTFNGETFDRFY